MLAQWLRTVVSRCVVQREQHYRAALFYSYNLSAPLTHLSFFSLLLSLHKTFRLGLDYH